MEDILSTSTQLTNRDISKEDRDENLLGLHSDAYAQSSQASAAAQKPAVEAVAQQSSLPVGNALLRNSVEIPSLEIFEQKNAPKATETKVTDPLVRFSMAALNDVSQLLNARTPKQTLMSDFHAQLNIAQLDNGRGIAARIGNVIINSESSFGNRIAPTRSAATLGILSPMKLEPVVQTSPSPSSEGVRPSYETKLPQVKPQNERSGASAPEAKVPTNNTATESKPLAGKPAESKSEPRPVEVKVQENIVPVSRPAEIKVQESLPQVSRPEVKVQESLPPVSKPAEIKVQEIPPVFKPTEIKVQDGGSREARPEGPRTENREQSGQQKQSDGNPVIEQLGRIVSTAVDLGASPQDRNPSARPVTKNDGTASDTRENVPGPQVDRQSQSERKPSSVDYSINNGVDAAPVDQKPGSQSTRLQSGDAGRKLAAESEEDLSHQRSQPIEKDRKIAPTNIVADNAQSIISLADKVPKPEFVAQLKLPTAVEHSPVSTEARGSSEPKPGDSGPLPTSQRRSGVPDSDAPDGKPHEVLSSLLQQKQDPAKTPPDKVSQNGSPELTAGTQLAGRAFQSTTPAEVRTHNDKGGAVIPSNNTDGVKPLPPQKNHSAAAAVAGDETSNVGSVTPKLSPSAKAASAGDNNAPAVAASGLRTGAEFPSVLPPKVRDVAPGTTSGDNNLSARQLLNQSSARPGDGTSVKPAQDPGIYHNVYRRGADNNDGLTLLARGLGIDSTRATRAVDKSGQCDENDNKKVQQPKVQSEPNPTRTVNAPSNNDRVTTEKPVFGDKPSPKDQPATQQRQTAGERERTTGVERTSGLPDKVVEPAKPRTDVKPNESGSLLPKVEPIKHQSGAPDKVPAQETVPSPKLEGAKPADAAPVNQTAGDRRPVKTEAVPVTENGTIGSREGLPKPASNDTRVATPGEPRPAPLGTIAVAQAVLNPTEKAPQSIEPMHRAGELPGSGILTGLRNATSNGTSEKPVISRNVAPTGTDLTVKHGDFTTTLSNYLQNKGHQIGDFRRDVSERLRAALHLDGKDGKPTTPSETAKPQTSKPHADAIKTLPAVLKPIPELKPVSEPIGKIVPTAKDAPKAVAHQQPAKPLDTVVAPLKLDPKRLPTDIKPATVGDATTIRGSSEPGGKLRIPTVNVPFTKTPDVKVTKGDTPRAILPESSGPRVNSGIRPIKPGTASTNGDAPTAKGPLPVKADVPSIKAVSPAINGNVNSTRGDLPSNKSIVPASVKGDGSSKTRTDSILGIKLPVPQEIKGNNAKADVSGLSRRDAKQIISESTKDIKATEVKAPGIKPVEVAGSIKSNSPRAISVDNVNGGRKAEQVATVKEQVATVKGDIKVNKTDSSRIVKGDSIPVVKVDTAKVNKVDVARVIKADQPQANIVGDRNAKVTVKSDTAKAETTKADAAIKPGTVTRADAFVSKSDVSTKANSVAKNDGRSIKSDVTRVVKADAVKPATVDLTKFDLSKSAKAEIIRSIKSNVPQLAEQIKVVKSDAPQTVKVDVNGLRKVDAAKVVKSDVSKVVEPKTVKIDSTTIRKPEVANVIKADVVKFNAGRAAEIKVADAKAADAKPAGTDNKVPTAKVENNNSSVGNVERVRTTKVEGRVPTTKVENAVDAVKVENRVNAIKIENGIKTARSESGINTAKVENGIFTAVDKRVSSANIETAKVVEAKLTGTKLAPIDTIQTVKVGVAQIKSEGSPSSQIDKLFGKLDSSIKVKTDKSLTAHEFINKVSERANLKNQSNVNVKSGDIAVVRVENATISGDVRKVTNRELQNPTEEVTGKDDLKVDSKNLYAEAKSELRRILKGDKNTGESKNAESKEAAQVAWPIEGLLVRGRVGGLQVKESEEVTSTLNVPQEFEEYLYEDESADYGSDAFYFPGLKAALKFCEVVGLVELEEKLEQKKKADSEKQEVKRTLSPTRVKYEVQPGDTLKSIAIEKLGDERFVDLIVTLNRSEITFRTDDGVRVPLVFAGQLLWLPSEEERSIYQKHYFSGKANKNGTPSVQISTGEDSETRTARVSAQQRLHSEAMQEQFAPQADAKATRIQRKRLPSDSAPIAQTLEKLRFAGNRPSVKWNEVNTGDPISGRESYQVKLGETLQSIAISHPRMGDVRFWVIIAALNDLPTHVDQYGQPIAIVENGQFLVLPTALELIDFCTTGNITGPIRRSRNTGSHSSAGDTVIVPNMAVSICQVQTEKIVDIRNFTPTARMIVSESSTDMDQFSIKLQVVVGYEWKLIASYDSFRGTATRTRYGINGIKATMRLNLPLGVVRQMAVEDFSRNWTFHRDAFEANKPESRERTSGFNLRPVV